MTSETEERHTPLPWTVESYLAGNGTSFMRVLGPDGDEVCAIRVRPGDEDDALLSETEKDQK